MVGAGSGPGQDTNLSDVITITVELTDDEFKALPTTPFVLVSPTETLNYSGFPSSVPILVGATVILNNAAGAYIADSDSFLVIGMGSDWSTNLTQKADNFPLINAGLQIITFGSPMVANIPNAPPTSSFIEAISTNLNGTVLDNAIILAASNAGNFGGGNAANKCWVVLAYQLFET